MEVQSWNLLRQNIKIYFSVLGINCFRLFFFFFWLIFNSWWIDQCASALARPRTVLPIQNVGFVVIDTAVTRERKGGRRWWEKVRPTGIYLWSWTAALSFLSQPTLEMHTCRAAACVCLHHKYANKTTEQNAVEWYAIVSVCVRVCVCMHHSHSFPTGVPVW